MSAKKAGLGRGLGSLGLDQKREISSIEGITLLAVTSITANPRQARQIFDEEALQALADSIRRYGVVQPIVVRPLADKTYELIAGERRWRASQRAGLKEIPALIRTYEDTKATEISLIENIQRENLNVIEEAAAYKLLIDMNNWKQDELAAKVGKSRSHVANIMRLLSLAPPVRKLIECASGGNCGEAPFERQEKNGYEGCRYIYRRFARSFENALRNECCHPCSKGKYRENRDLFLIRSGI